jgi:hypothetical protein
MKWLTKLFSRRVEQRGPVYRVVLFSTDNHQIAQGLIYPTGYTDDISRGERTYTFAPEGKLKVIADGTPGYCVVKKDGAWFVLMHIGTIKVVVINHGDDTLELRQGDRIAQLIVERCSQDDMIEVSSP